MSDIFDFFITTLNNSYSLPRYAIGALPKGKKITENVYEKSFLFFDSF